MRSGAPRTRTQNITGDGFEGDPIDGSGAPGRPSLSETATINPLRRAFFSSPTAALTAESTGAVG